MLEGGKNWRHAFSPQNVYVFETGKKICLVKLSQTKMEARGKNVASILELVFW